MRNEKESLAHYARGLEFIQALTSNNMVSISDMVTNSLAKDFLNADLTSH